MSEKCPLAEVADASLYSRLGNTQIQVERPQTSLRPFVVDLGVSQRLRVATDLGGS